jgi:hypothetical protein
MLEQNERLIVVTKTRSQSYLLIKNMIINFGGSSPKELADDKDSGVQGFEDSSEMLRNYKELKVWQKSYQPCLEICRITARFPKDEKFGLTSQIRRGGSAMDARQQQIISRLYILPMDQIVNWKPR